jgi:hypothetical protein
MKTTNNFFYMFLALIVLISFMYCGGNGSGNTDSDTATATRIDSVTATQHDPASIPTAPPVTGNQTDSSRTLDSPKRKN